MKQKTSILSFRVMLRIEMRHPAKLLALIASAIALAAQLVLSLTAHAK